MIIGSVAGFSFNDFIMVATPVSLIVLAAVTELVALYYKREIKADPAASSRLKDVDESKLIVNRPLMIKSVIIIFFVLLGFILCRMINVEASTVALTGAGLLLAISYADEASIIHNDIEWPTLIYFISLFVMGGALRVTGVIDRMAHLLIVVLAGNPLLMLLGILWISGITCMFVNNIAYTTIFVRVVQAMATAANIPAAPLFWALAFGACLGGNGTYFGAAANAVVVDFAAKEGMPVSFGSFCRLGVRAVLVSLVIASIGLVVIGWPVISK
jgi:Na+/H+ antiporter NhaD/arsenite permease-like protein